MIVKVHARTENALKGITEHYNDSKKIKNRFTLSAWGVSQELDVNKKVLTINFKGLIKKILNKGGANNGFHEKLKSDFLKDLNKVMLDAGAEKNSYEVVFSDEY